MELPYHERPYRVWRAGDKENTIQCMPDIVEAQSLARHASYDGNLWLVWSVVEKQFVYRARGGQNA